MSNLTRNTEIICTRCQTKFLAYRAGAKYCPECIDRMASHRAGERKRKIKKTMV